MKKIAILSALLSVFVAATNVRAELFSPLEALGGYNVVVLNDLTFTGWNGHIEGHVAVGNDMTVVNRGAGIGIGNGATTNVNDTLSALYVRNNLNLNNNTTVGVHGNVYTGNVTTTNVSISRQNGVTGSYLTSDPFGSTSLGSFDGMASQLRASALTLSAMESTTGVTFTDYYGNKTITAESGVQVLNIELSSLYNAGAGQFFIEGNADTTLIVNILGADGYDTMNFTNGDFKFTGDEFEILFNFVDVETINVNGMSPIASILAVDSTLNLSNGNIAGTVVAYDMNVGTGGETHSDNPFTGDVDGPPTATTPEPATILIVGLGLGALPLARRFRKKTA